MAQMEFTAKADYTEVDGLINKINELERKLKSIDVSSNAADVKRLTGELSAARGQLDELAASAANSSQQMVQWAAGLAGVFSATQFAKQVFEVRSQFQDLEAGFKVMLGSGEKAKQLLGEVTDFAAKTPFDLLGVASGTQQLLAYGTKAEEVTGTLRKLGDIAAGLNIPLGQLIYLYGTTIAQGRMYTMDLRQFQNRGIPMAKELANVMGITEKEVAGMVTAGKVTNKEFTAAIDNMTKQGGRFGGLMEARSKTLSGQWSNIQDTISQAFNEMGQSTEGFFNALLQGTAWAVDHWRELGTAIAGAAAAVGGYKAALMAVNAINKVNQKAALIRAGKEDGKSPKAPAKTGNVVAENGVIAANTKVLASEKQITMERQKAVALTMQDAKSREVLALTMQKRQKNEELGGINAKVQKAEGELDVLQKTGAAKEDIAAKENELLTLYGEQYQKQDEILQKSNELKQASAELNEQQQTFNDLATQAAEAAGGGDEGDDGNAAASEKAAEATEVLTAAEEANTAAEEVNSAANEVNTAAKEGNTVAAETNATATAIGTTATEANSVAEGTNTTSTELNSTAQKTNTISREANTTATKAGTVATETNKVATEGDAAAKGTNTTATNALTVAMDNLKTAYATNPIGMWIAGITLAVTAIMELCMWLDKEEESIDKANDAFNSTMSDYEAKIRATTAMLQFAEVGTKEYKDIMEQLNAICRELGVAEYDLNTAYENQVTITENLTAAVRKLAAARAMQAYEEEAAHSENEAMDEAMKKLYSRIGNEVTGGFEEAELTPEQKAGLNRLAQSAVEEYRKAIIQNKPEEANKALVKGLDKIKKYTKDIGYTLFDPTMHVKNISQERQMEALIDNYFGDITKKVDKHVEGTKIVEARYKAMSDAVIDAGKATAKAMENMSADELIEGYKAAEGEMTALSNKAKETGRSLDDITEKDIKVTTDDSQLDDTNEKLNEVPTRIEMANGVVMTIPADNKNILDTQFQIDGVSYKIAEVNGKLMIVDSNNNQITDTQKELNIVERLIGSVNGTTLSPSVDTSVIGRINDLIAAYMKLASAQAVANGEDPDSPITRLLTSISNFAGRLGGKVSGGKVGSSGRKSGSSGGNGGSPSSGGNVGGKGGKDDYGRARSTRDAYYDKLLSNAKSAKSSEDATRYEKFGTEQYEKCKGEGDMEGAAKWAALAEAAKKRKSQITYKSPRPSSGNKRTNKPKRQQKQQKQQGNVEITRKNLPKKYSTYMSKNISTLDIVKLKEIEGYLDDMLEFYANDAGQGIKGAQEKVDALQRRKKEIGARIGDIEAILNKSDITFENEKLNRDYWDDYKEYVKNIEDKTEQRRIKGLKGVEKELAELGYQRDKDQEAIIEELREFAEKRYEIEKQKWLNQNKGYDEKDYEESVKSAFVNGNPDAAVFAEAYEKVREKTMKDRKINPLEFKELYKEKITDPTSTLYRDFFNAIAKKLGGDAKAKEEAKRILANKYYGDKAGSLWEMALENLLMSYEGEVNEQMDSPQLAYIEAYGKTIKRALNDIGDLQGEINKLTDEKKLKLDDLNFIKKYYQEASNKAGVSSEDKAIFAKNIAWVESLIKHVEDGYTKAVEEAKFEDLKKKVKFDELFDNFDDATIAQLEKMKTTLEGMFNSAGLSAKAYQEVLEKIKETENAIAERKKTGFQKALENALPKRTERRNLQSEIAEYNKKIEALLIQRGLTFDKGEIADLENRLQAVLKKREAAQGKFNNLFGKDGKDTFASVEAISEQYQLINQNLQSMPDLLRNIGVDENSDFFKGTEKLAEASQAGQDALQNIMSLNFVGALSDVAKMWTSLAESFGSFFNLDADYNSYHRMLEEYERLNEVWQQIIDRKREYLSISYGEEARKVGEEAEAILQTSVEAARKLGKEWMNAGAGVGSHSRGVRQRKRMDAEDIENAAAVVGMEAISGRMTGLFDLTREQLEKLQDEAPAFWSKLDDKTKEYLQTIIDGAKTAEDILDETKERINGISFDGLSDNFFNTLLDMKAGTREFMNSFEDMMKRAVLQEAYQRQIAPALEKWYDRWYERMQGGLTAAEQAAAEAEYRNLVQQGLEMRDSLRKTMGWGESSSQNGSSGGFGNMSQETADVMNGRLTSIQIAVQSILANMNATTSEESLLNLKADALVAQCNSFRDIASEMRDYQVRSFLELQGINENTGNTVSQLGMINKTMTDIYDKVKTI